MGKRKRNNNKPTSLEKKGENADWSFKRLGGEPPPATPGRREGETVIYSPEQTERYQSQWVRYQKALAIAARGPDAIKDGVYYYRASNRPYPEVRRVRGIDDWWPTRPPLTPIKEYGDPIFGNFNDDGEQGDPYSDPYSNDELLPPDSPNNGGFGGLKANGFTDGFGTPESIQPPAGGGKYSRSPDEFWKVRAGGAPWVIGAGDWTETGDDSFTHETPAGTPGSLYIESPDEAVDAGINRPFEGGQCCDKTYLITARATFRPRNVFGACTSSVGPEQVSDASLQGKVLGVFGENVDIFGAARVYALMQQCNGTVYEANIIVSSSSCYNNHTSTVVPYDGSADNCGNPPVILER